MKHELFSIVEALLLADGPSEDQVSQIMKLCGEYRTTNLPLAAASAGHRGRSSKPPENLLKYVGIIEQVSEPQHGSNERGSYVKYSIKVDGHWYSAFNNHQLGEVIRTCQPGQQVSVGYLQMGKFLNLYTLEILPADIGPAPGTGDAPTVPNEKDQADGIPF